MNWYESLPCFYCLRGDDYCVSIIGLPTFQIHLPLYYDLVLPCHECMQAHACHTILVYLEALVIFQLSLSYLTRPAIETDFNDVSITILDCKSLKLLGAEESNPKLE